MNNKMIFLASVAALTAASSASAADAIVASEPEAVEYVRVCDAYGTGYFYIPGSETCLKIGGYIRTEERFGRDLSGPSDWSSWTRAQVYFTSKSDTEWGTLTGNIVLRTNAEDASSGNTFADEAWIDLAGFRAGMQYSWWDDDPSGETDVVSSNSTRHNSIRYQYETDTFAAGVMLDELEDNYATKFGENPNDLGVAAQVSAKYGAFSAYLLGGYDTDTEEGAIRAIVYADIGPGQLGVYGVWASGANYYYEDSKWTVGAQYQLKLTDKWAVTPGFQYFGDVANPTTTVGDREYSNGFSNDDAWTAGVTVDYKIVDNLATKLSVQYHDEDAGEDEVLGFLRLQRDF
jgi:hypothetical protein